MLVKILFILILAQVSIQSEFEFTNNSPFGTVFKRQYSLFDVWIDCKERIPVLFYYLAEKDIGSFLRKDPTNFPLDPEIPKDCQPLNGKPYSNDYDRGHMVPVNHLDHSEQAMKESYYMTNINPQYYTLNRGAWSRTEKITECLRDLDTLKVYGGAIMGNDESNDIFIESHGIRTADFFWKIIENTRTNDVIAWIMPNDATATYSNLEKYLVSIKDIEARSGFIFQNFTNEQKQIRQATLWATPKECK